MPGNKRPKRKPGKKRVQTTAPGGDKTANQPGAKGAPKNFGPSKSARGGFTPAIVRRSQRGK